MPITVVAIFLLDFFNPYFLFIFFFFCYMIKIMGFMRTVASKSWWCAWAQNRHKRMDVES